MSGGGEELEITISRRPNRRASMEKAPGPRQSKAAAMVAAKAAAGLDASKPQAGSGNNESALPRLLNPATMLANGVIYPSRSNTELMNNSRQTARLMRVEVCQSDTQEIPWETRVAPRAARNSNRPTPGVRPGNVENRRCSPYLPG